MLYVNFRGEEAIRHVVPYENGLRFGANEWHKEPQYLLRVYDLDKREDREFAMSGIKIWDVEGDPIGTVRINGTFCLTEDEAAKIASGDLITWRFPDIANRGAQQ